MSTSYNLSINWLHLYELRAKHYLAYGPAHPPVLIGQVHFYLAP